MRKHEITIYTYDELAPKVQAKVLDNLREWNTSDDWWDPTYEDAKDIGLEITAFDLYRRTIEGTFLLSAAEAAQNILTEHGDMCETYKTAESFLEDWQPVFDSYMDATSEKYESPESEVELLEIEDKFRTALLHNYLTLLQHDYDYLTDNDTLIEQIHEGEYKYHVNGRQYMDEQ